MSDIPAWAMERARAEAEHYARWLHAGNSVGRLSEHAIDGLADSIARLVLSVQRETREQVIAQAQKRANRMRSNEMYPAFGLDSQVAALEDFARSLSDEVQDA